MGKRLKMNRIYYVYRHLRINCLTPFYVGMGKNRRYCETRHKYKEWNDIVDSDGGFRWQIVADGLTRDEALELEALLISEHDNLVNQSPGPKNLPFEYDGISFNSRKEASKATGISQRTLYSWQFEGRKPCSKNKDKWEHYKLMTSKISINS